MRSALPSENDPFGTDAHSPGTKLDTSKPEPELVYRGFANALEEVIRVATDGAIKYSRDGWITVPEGERRYRNAGHRHRNKFYRGEARDTETGHHHIAHEIWNRLAELELILRGQNGN